MLANALIAVHLRLKGNRKYCSIGISAKPIIPKILKPILIFKGFKFEIISFSDNEVLVKCDLEIGEELLEELLINAKSSITFKSTAYVNYNGFGHVLNGVFVKSIEGFEEGCSVSLSYDVIIISDLER